MNNWKYKLAHFFMGRYGLDSLYTALTVGAFVLIFVNLFLGWWIIDTLIMAMLIWSLFRTFSRNIPARCKENEIWLKIWKKITFGKGGTRPRMGGNPYGNPYGNFGYGGYGGYQQTYTPPKPPKKKKLKTDRDHCFRICPECRANIRLPKKRGKHTVVCPRCRCRFEVRI